MDNYFFDSYAIIKTIEEDKNYILYREKKIITSSLNLMEVYYYLLRKFNKQTAEYWMKNLDVELVNVIRLDLAIEAAYFKFEHKNKKLSYVDCLGYILARRWKIKFLTGDKEFEGKENVEFVK